MNMTLLFLVIAAIIIYYVFIYRDSIKLNFFTGRGNLCPNCHNPVEDSFNVCPICKETLKKKCPNCQEHINPSWKYCPFCEKPADGSVDK